MEYLIFSALFTVLHIISYYTAGAINYRFTKDIYTGEDSLSTYFLRDTSKKEEISRINKLLIPAQIIRGLLMSVVLYPLLGPLGDLSFVVRFAFLGGIMLIYADFASAIPFCNTIEGLVYMKKRFVTRDIFLKIGSEAVIYSVLFGLLSSYFLF